MLSVSGWKKIGAKYSLWWCLPGVCHISLNILAPMSQRDELCFDGLSFLQPVDFFHMNAHCLHTGEGCYRLMTV